MVGACGADENKEFWQASPEAEREAFTSVAAAGGQNENVLPESVCVIIPPPQNRRTLVCPPQEAL